MMKKLIASILALTAAVSLTACGGEASKQPDDGKITLYTLTEERHYNASGELMNRTGYTYDHRGLMTCREVDSVERTTVWNEEMLVYVSEEKPCDGVIDKRFTATYNEQGYLTGYEKCTELNADGELVMKPGDTFTYEFDDQGRPVNYAGKNAQGMEFLGQLISYDDQGRVAKARSPLDSQAGDTVLAEYDDQGRLSSFYIHLLEADVRQTYTYNDLGQLTRVDIARFRGEDDSTDNYMEYVYDSHGNCVEKNYYTIADAQTLSKEYVHTYDGDTLVKTQVDGCTQTYDANGNIVRVDFANGTYSEYTYQSVRVTPEEAKLSTMQWEYKQGEERMWTGMTLPVEMNDCIVNYLMPRLMNYWF